MRDAQEVHARIASIKILLKKAEEEKDDEYADILKGKLDILHWFLYVG